MKGFDLSLWPNRYKEPESKQPDAKGTISFPISVLKELANAYQAKELKTEIDSYNGDIEIVKLDVAAWRNDPEGNRPVIKGLVSNLAEMKESQARRDAKNAEASGGGSNDSTGGWGVPF